VIRWLAGVLLLVNLAFALAVHVGLGGGRGDAPDAQLLDLQMNAAKVRVVAGGQDRPAPRGPTAQCLAWGPFGPGEADAAREALATLAGAERVVRRELAASAWWVHVPPLRSRAEAQRRAGELRAQGVEGARVVESPAALVNAIDLGLYAEEPAARERLATLRTAGVRGAVVIERPGGPQWLVRDPGEGLLAEVLAIKQARFPLSWLGTQPCPASGG